MRKSKIWWPLVNEKEQQQNIKVKSSQPRAEDVVTWKWLERQCAVAVRESCSSICHKHYTKFQRGKEQLNGELMKLINSLNSPLATGPKLKMGPWEPQRAAALAFPCPLRSSCCCGLGHPPGTAGCFSCLGTYRPTGAALGASCLVRTSPLVDTPKPPSWIRTGLQGPILLFPESLCSVIQLLSKNMGDLRTNGWELKGQITNIAIAITERELARFMFYIKSSKSYLNPEVGTLITPILQIM